MTTMSLSQRVKLTGGSQYKFLSVSLCLVLLTMALIAWIASEKVSGRRADLKDLIDKQKLEVSQATQNGRIVADIVFGEIRQALKASNLPAGEGEGELRQEGEYYEYLYSRPTDASNAKRLKYGQLLGLVPAKEDSRRQNLLRVMQHLYDRDLNILDKKWASRVVYTYWMSRDQNHCLVVPRWDFSAAISGSPQKTAKSAMGELANAMLIPFEGQIKNGEGQIFRTDAWIDTTDGRALQTMVSPMFDASGAWIGNAAVDFSLEEIDRLLGESGMAEAQWLLVTANGTLLARHIDKQGVLAKLLWGSALSEAAISLPTAKDGVEFISGDMRGRIAAVPSSDLYLYLLTPIDWVSQDLSVILLVGGAGVLLLVFGLGIVWRILARRERDARSTIEKAEQELKAYTSKLEMDSVIKTLLAEISNDLHQADSLVVFVRTIMSRIASAVAADYAAFYVMDGTGQRLLPVGGYGVNAEDLANVELGQGLIGQCAKDVRSIAISAGENTDARIVWGQGSIVPKSILYLPLMQAGHALGVVVIGAMRDFSAENQLLLEAVLPMLAMNLEILNRNLAMQQQAESIRKARIDRNLELEKTAAGVGQLAALLSEFKSDEAQERLQEIARSLDIAL